MISFCTVYLCFLTILININISYCLECYVCDNQEKNAEKCLNTIITCEQDEDVCLTEISWGSAPYWTYGDAKQYYVSKRCSSKERCARYHNEVMPYCTHIWYQDWKCLDCCKGDRCNYYIISGSKHNLGKFLVIFSGVMIVGFINKFTV